MSTNGQAQAPEAFTRLSSGASLSGGMALLSGQNTAASIERIGSTGGVPFSPALDKLANGGTAAEFQRIASLGSFAAAQSNPIARVPSAVGALPAETFARTAPFFPLASNQDFQRLGSLASSIAQLSEPLPNNADGTVPQFVPL